MIAAKLRELIKRVPALGVIVKSRVAQHLIQTLRAARAVHEPLRFVALQLGPARTAPHRLRDSNLKVFLRHRTRDIHILNEIFGGTAGRNSYEPPAELASALDANPSPTVLDLGANVGLFGLYVLGRWPGAAVRSFEPDPANLDLLCRTIAANGLEGRWSVTDVAVANHTGEMSFASGLSADSHLVVAGAQTVRASEAGTRDRPIRVRTIDIFAEDHDVDVMKMDIEGGEWAVLTDARLSDLGANALVLEWHARGCPEGDAHAATVRLLNAAGYSRLQEIEFGPDNGLLWAWREKAPPPELKDRCAGSA